MIQFYSARVMSFFELYSRMLFFMIEKDKPKELKVFKDDEGTLM